LEDISCELVADCTRRATYLWRHCAEQLCFMLFSFVTPEFHRQGGMAIPESKQYLYSLIAKQLADDGLGQVASALTDALSLPAAPSDLGSNTLASLVDKAKQQIDTEGPHPLSLNDGLGDEVMSTLSAVSSVECPELCLLHTVPHKDMVRMAKFSLDGTQLLTASDDGSLKLHDVSKIHAYAASTSTKQRQEADYFTERDLFSQIREDDDKDSVVIRPLIKTLLDHETVIYDLDFHPVEPFFATASKDSTIKFFDQSRATIKRAYKSIQLDSEARSISFHPSGDFLVVGTKNPIVRLYDVNTFQPFISTDVNHFHSDLVTMVRYSPSGSSYASCSRDGTIKIWDGVSSQCVRTIWTAHSGFVVDSIEYSSNGKYILSCGRDSMVRLWDISTGRQIQSYAGAVHQRRRLNAQFLSHGEMVCAADENSEHLFFWDTVTGQVVQKVTELKSPVRWIAPSPTELCLVTCTEDQRARVWGPEPDVVEQLTAYTADVHPPGHAHKTHMHPHGSSSSSGATQQPGRS